MDRFKFRAWNLELKRYEYGIQNGCSFGIYLNHHIVEQCTGLNDKNGKLIYEGDILGGIYGGYIGWCEEEKSFELFAPEYGCMSCSGDILWQEIVEDDGILEVIGNIHENKELLS